MRTLKEARLAMGVKQCAVANALGIARQTYAKYERDSSRMPVIKAKEACAFLGVPFDEIFFGMEGKLN